MKKCKRDSSTKILYLAMTLLVFFFLGNPLEVKAVSNEEVTSSGFSISPVFPENQRDTGLSYFDLMMSPSQQQTIAIDVANATADPITLDIAYNSAKTNRSGGIEYGDYAIENDASLVNDFVNIVSGPESIEVPGGSTSQVELTIQMPDVPYDGVIAGGVTLTPIVEETEDSSSVEGSRVDYAYAYAVSVLLRENDTELVPDLQFRSAYGGTQNYRNTIYVSLSNVIATYVEGLTIDAQISRAGSEEILWESRSTAMRMAPNSYINFPVSMNGDRMEAGNYTAHVKAYAGGQTWEFTEDFEITEEEAEEFNQLDVALVQDRGVDWRIIAGIVGGVVVLLLVIFLIMHQRKNKQKKAAAEKAARRKRKKNEE